jgi:hypothetical protein
LFLHKLDSSFAGGSSNEPARNEDALFISTTFLEPVPQSIIVI